MEVAVNVGVGVLVGVNVGVELMSSTNAQSTCPVESVAQLSFPVIVGVFVGVGTEHGPTPLNGSVTPADVSSTIRAFAAVYKAILACCPIGAFISLE